MGKAVLIVWTMVLAAACTTLPAEVREQVAPGLDFAAVQADPARYAGSSLMLGGAVVELRDDGEGSLLQMLRWEVNRWGEPLALAESGDRFLVRTSQPLDPDLYTPGRLVTLIATVGGTGTISRNLRDETVMLFDLQQLHLWETPFRYGLHPNPDPNQPEYVTPQGPGPDHPYDPTPWAFPYAPSWYRNQYHPPLN